RLDLPRISAVESTGLSYFINELRPNEIMVLTDSDAWSYRRKRTSGQYRYTAMEMAEIAHRAGASAILSSSAIEGARVPILVVEDTRKALWQAAMLARERFTNTVVGITGTVGKSSTKDVLSLLL